LVGVFLAFPSFISSCGFGGMLSMRSAIRRVVSSRCAFGALAMVKIDPQNVQVTLPDAFLIAIGKICVQWSMLEYVVEMAITKLVDLDIWDQRSKIVFAHMSWPQKTDILGALTDTLEDDYARLRGYRQTVAPLLKKAQEARNQVIHGFYGVEDGKVQRTRATARGKLKLEMEEITVSQIEAGLKDIHDAIAAVYNLVLGT
jgi:hypothetical protein